MFVVMMILAMAPVSVAATVHHHKWKLSYQNWSPDCMQTTIISINGQYPGPSFRAREGDTIVVEIENKMPTENVVIHWHGVRQVRFGLGHQNNSIADSCCDRLFLYFCYNTYITADVEINMRLAPGRCHSCHLSSADVIVAMCQVKIRYQTPRLTSSPINQSAV